MGKVLTLEAVLLLYITTSGRVHSGKHDKVVYFVLPSKLTSVSQYIHISLHFKACFSHKLTQQMNVCSFFNAFSSYSKRNKVYGARSY